MPIYQGTSTKNKSEIVINGTQMQKVYVGDRLVWVKPSGIFLPEYGLLYNWYATQGTGNASLTSDDDWVVPTSTQQTTLRTNAGGATSGTKLKEVGTTYWTTANGTNIYGFNGRGGGHRTSGFDNEKNEAGHWARTQYNATLGYMRILQNATADYFQQAYTKYYGEGIRLLYVGAGTPTSYTGTDGKVYGIVAIGSTPQYWLADNLSETRFRDGSIIPWYGADAANYFTNAEWAALTTAGCCAYDNTLSNVATGFTFPT